MPKNVRTQIQDLLSTRSIPSLFDKKKKINKKSFMEEGASYPYNLTLSHSPPKWKNKKRKFLNFHSINSFKVYSSINHRAKMPYWWQFPYIFSRNIYVTQVKNDSLITFLTELCHYSMWWVFRNYVYVNVNKKIYVIQFLTTWD